MARLRHYRAKSEPIIGALGVMRSFIFISLFTLFSCSDLSNDEKKLVGHWEWSTEVEGYGDKGILKLESNRDVTYYQESWNPSERKSFDRGELRFGWKIIGDKLCIATKWQGNEFLEKECPFKVTHFNEEYSTIIVDGMFVRKEIQLSRID